MTPEERAARMKVLDELVEQAQELDMGYGPTEWGPLTSDHDKDATIRSLAMALKEALIWGWVEHKPGPTYEVPYAIDGDLWRMVKAADKATAYRLIRTAVDEVVNRGGGEVR
jgi:hypothetical protein